ncbi:hypothetical protein acdb102_45980 [Acidothermaceae bacterium B102]|nr:hypothetical protein acdb102_45980 [Acidothermaceae bacterium B102]
MRGPSSRVRRNLAKGILPLGIIASAGVVWQSSYAAFSATTSNAGNTLTAGTVKLTDAANGTALLNATGLKPGSTGVGCIKLTYGGSLAAATKLYIAGPDLTTSTPSNLAPYLTLKVDEGTGVDPACSDFVSSANDYNPTNSTALTLNTFASSATNFATGVGNWSPAAAGATKTYRFSWTVQDNNAAQGLNATVKLTWEAQNT